MNITAKLDMTVNCCPSCGITFAVPTEHEACKRRAWERHGPGPIDPSIWLYCPNGHRYGWPDIRHDRLEAEPVVREAHYREQLEAALDEARSLRAENKCLNETVAAKRPRRRRGDSPNPPLFPNQDNRDDAI